MWHLSLCGKIPAPWRMQRMIVWCMDANSACCVPVQSWIIRFPIIICGMGLNFFNPLSFCLWCLTFWLAVALKNQRCRTETFLKSGFRGAGKAVITGQVQVNIFFFWCVILCSTGEIESHHKVTIYADFCRIWWKLAHVKEMHWKTWPLTSHT